MAAKGQRLLDASIAFRASEIDVALVAGCGFPVIDGGPMFCAAEGGGLRPGA